MKREILKHVMLALGVSFFGFCSQSFAQDVILPEVEVSAVNYKYVSSVDDEDLALPVKRLVREVAAFDLLSSDFYKNSGSTYLVSFNIPEGYILAAYNKEGKLLRTTEKFKNISLPLAVLHSVSQKYPNWRITKDVYRVNYLDAEGANKKYKILLKNGKQRERVSINEKGEFI